MDDTLADTKKELEKIVQETQVQEDILKQIEAEEVEELHERIQEERARLRKRNAKVLVAWRWLHVQKIFAPSMDRTEFQLGPFRAWWCRFKTKEEGGAFPFVKPHYLSLFTSWPSFHQRGFDFDF